MSKFLKVMIALVVIAGMAVPAMAEMKLNGYYRLQFVSDNIKNAGNKDAKAENQIDQRLRMKLTNTLNDNVRFVYYAEVDTPWGQKGSTPSGSTETGGTDGADGVNLETKNVYLDVEIPNTFVSMRAGIQGFGNKNGVIIGDDIPALLFSAKISDQVSITALYSKFFEDDKTKWDDEDYYTLLANLKPSDALSLNAGLAWYDSNGLADRGLANGIITSTHANEDYEDANLYTLFVEGDANLGVAQLEGQAAYQFGSADSAEGAAGVKDMDFAGYMASVKAKAKAADMADLGLRLTYYSSDDDNDNDNEIFLGDVTGADGEFSGENLSIFFHDAYYNNTNGGGLAIKDAAYKGNGLFAINATADVAMGSYNLKAGAGYFMALEKIDKKDTDLGFEVAADFGRKLAEKVDLRLIGAYAVLGDFYSNAGNSNDPDDIYVGKVVMNVSF